MTDLLGDEIMRDTAKIWDFDSEGEFNGVYRPTGHPGLWFATGNFMFSRSGSFQCLIIV